METQGQRIAAARGALGWTQERLASAINRTFQQVSARERGEGSLRSKSLHDLAQAMGVSAEWLRTGKGPPGGPWMGEYLETHGYTRVPLPIDEYLQQKDKVREAVESGAIIFDQDRLISVIEVIHQVLDAKRVRLPGKVFAMLCAEAYLESMRNPELKGDTLITRLQPLIRIALGSIG